MANGLSRKKVVEIPKKKKRPVKRKKNVDSTPRRQTTTEDILQAVAPQAVGLLVGGLLGGREGAIAGGQAGAQTGAVLNARLDAAQERADQRHDVEFTQDLALDAAQNKQEQQEIANEIALARVNNKGKELGKRTVSKNLFDKVTGEPLVTDNSGQVTDLQGNVVAGNRIGTVAGERLKDADATRKLSSRRAEQADKRIAQTDRAFEEAKRNKDELSDKQVAEITDIETGLESLGKIRDLGKRVNTGPIAGRAQSQAAKIGQASDDFVKLKTETGNTLATYVKSISGGAVSEEEAQRLAQLIPSINDDESTFNAKLEQFEGILNTSLNKKAKNIQRFQGKSVPVQDTFDDLFE